MNPRAFRTAVAVASPAAAGTLAVFAFASAASTSACLFGPGRSASDAGASTTLAPSDASASATSDAGGPNDAGASATSDAGGADGAVAGCATDAVTGVTLCTFISYCPELAIDHDAYPNCGFRLRLGGSYDLACWCDGYVCPMGTPSTCAEAAALLANQNELQICQQVNEGRCTQPQASGATSSGGTMTPACKACREQCGQTPGCIAACAC